MRQEISKLNRRELIQSGLAFIASPGGVASLSGAVTGAGPSRWIKSPSGPVLGGDLGTCFDVCLIRERHQLKMWFSWRPKKSIALTESVDGIHWSAPTICLTGIPESDWEDDVNRPIVVRRAGEYHLWYTGQAAGRSSIGYARSSDGKVWQRVQRKPVLRAEEPWEGVAVMVPHVLRDEPSGRWKMWYSGGEQYEPNAIGYAESQDGIHWERHGQNPVLQANPAFGWEKERVTAAQIVPYRGYYYAFYIGFRDVDHAQIGLARSKDGLTNWVRHAGNPIVSPTPGGWDADACYKPFALQTEGRWVLWYNGRSGSAEQIGRAIQSGRTLDFVESAQ